MDGPDKPLRAERNDPVNDTIRDSLHTFYYHQRKVATIIAKSSWNAAENGCECTMSSLQRPS